jgi:hypothetical protein
MLIGFRRKKGIGYIGESIFRSMSVAIKWQFCEKYGGRTLGYKGDKRGQEGVGGNGCESEKRLEHV